MLDFRTTTVYKASLSTLEDWKNLVTKIITKYPVVATFKILKIMKKNISNFFEKNCRFFYNFENLKVATTGYFVIIFVTRFFQSSSLHKPALYTVVQFSKKFPKFYPFFRRCTVTNFQQLFSKFENCKIDIIFSKIFSKLDNIQLFYNKNL